MNNWKIILTFTYPHEAYLVQGYLESEGINTMIKDELTAQVNNFYSNAIGGVKILVRETDYENGLAQLQKGGFIDYTPQKDEMNLIEADHSTDLNFCPYCQSDNIGKKKEPNMLVIIGYFLFGAFFPIFKKSYLCFDCHKEWKYKK